MHLQAVIIKRGREDAGVDYCAGLQKDNCALHGISVRLRPFYGPKSGRKTVVQLDFFEPCVVQQGDSTDIVLNYI